jgi:hypothetical protein
MFTQQSRKVGGNIKLQWLLLMMDLLSLLAIPCMYVWNKLHGLGAKRTTTDRSRGTRGN